MTHTKMSRVSQGSSGLGFAESGVDVGTVYRDDGHGDDSRKELLEYFFFIKSHDL